MSNHSDSTSDKPTQRDWILVVDDDAPILRMVSEMFSGSDLDVAHATSGVAALAVLDQAATDPLVVLVDVLMPGMDGLTLARKIRARDIQGRIALMSGHLSNMSWWPVDLREATFLAKPFRIADLMALVGDARAEYRLSP